MTLAYMGAVLISHLYPMFAVTVAPSAMALAVVFSMAVGTFLASTLPSRRQDSIRLKHYATSEVAMKY
jgi:ABC-type polysaccharide/polyol phosphate export permease